MKKHRVLDIKRSSNGATEGLYDPESGRAFLVADGLTAATAGLTLMHEVGIHVANDGNRLAPLIARVNRILDKSKAGAFTRRVRQWAAVEFGTR